MKSPEYAEAFAAELEKRKEENKKKRADLPHWERKTTKHSGMKSSLKSWAARRLARVGWLTAKKRRKSDSLASAASNKRARRRNSEERSA